MKTIKTIWKTHVGVKVYLSNGTFTDCYDQRKADKLTENEANEWLKKSTPYCMYWIEDVSEKNMKKKYEIWVDDIKRYVKITEKEAMRLKKMSLINYNEIEFRGVVYIEPVKKEKE